MTHNPFHTHIRTALANETLQAALDANAERRIRARIAAFASLPIDRETLRQRAHAVRSDVIANLDRYLDQFIDKVRGNGITVHRAADAEEARQIVIDITRNSPQKTPSKTKESFVPLSVLSGRKLIAKAKTMVSEEIELNQALEAEGIKVVETDLGEYIVQLRGERPSHIITPAVHLRRQEVGQTFHEKLGIPYTDDIPTLTDAARVALRQTFLNADIGLSGVNFGVAETGSLCILTNEGNGRMVTTVPRVHIALMGMERLVPTLDDLALMLTLLPRSATGQKITVYTQLLHSPRREGELDGAKERHLIILDNGRSALRGSPLNDALMCIRCGACLNACPIFREIGGHAYVGDRGQSTPYPGPIGSVLSPGLFGLAEFGHLAQASTLCGACKEACPIDIDLPGMLLRVRAGMTVSSVQCSVSSVQCSVFSVQSSVNGQSAVSGQRSAVGEPGIGLPKVLCWGLGMFTWVATNPWRFGLAQKLAAIFSRILSPRATYMRLPAITGWGYSKDFPRPVVRPFRERFESTNQQVGESTNQRISESMNQRISQ
ncbi:MAG: lactate utilization protein [Chloroflexi bacterium]|nr:lactate utilization protein [Chloroflexota bacterium]